MREKLLSIPEIKTRKFVSVLIGFVLLSGVVLGQTYSENFDTDGNWSGSYGSYAGDAYYTNASLDPSGDSFVFGTGLRETSITNSGAYAIRLDDLSSAYFLYECDVDVTSFTIFLAHWDVSDAMDVYIEYSVNSGSSFSNITTIDETWWTGDGLGDQDYKQYSSGALNISPDSGETIQIKIRNDGNERLLLDDFEVTYTSASANYPDWCNLQSPASGSITTGGAFNVYAQVFESGVTEAAGQGTGVSCWIGYNSANTDPSTWTNWVAASFNAQSGNNDEFIADIGSVIPTAGTYYYASKVTVDGTNFHYGGYNSGTWDGSTNINGTLTVNSNYPDWCNLQWPISSSITVGTSYDIFAKVYESGVTDAVGQGSNVSAWIGYNTTDTDPSTWTNWFAASYNGDTDANANDEYTAEIGSALPAGTYYYASRFNVNPNATEYKYGGYSVGGGGYWDGSTYDSQILTVLDPTLTTSTSSLSGFTYEEGSGPSSEQNFTIEGSNLTNDINITPPSNYEISIGTGGSFVAANPITLTQSGGTVSTTTIYVKLKSGLSEDTYNNEDITASSTGATNQTIECDGVVTAAPSVPILSSQIVATISTTGATLGATIDSDGGQPISERGTVWGTSSSPTGNSLSEGGTSVSSFSHARSGFTPNTLYYYRGYATNSQGTGYSADGTFTTLHNAPTIGSGSGATSSSISANWNAPTGGGSETFTFEIEVDDDNGFGSVDYTQNGISEGNLSTTATGLSSNTTYYYRVRAVNAGGNSAWSATSAGYTTLVGPTTLNTEDCTLNTWTAYDVAGDDSWVCDGDAYYMNGFGGTTDEDWLISPSINFDTYSNGVISFKTAVEYTGPDLELWHSTDYDGTSDPSSQGSWTQLSYTEASSTSFTSSGDVDLSAISGSAVYIAFKYVATGTESGEAAGWWVDDIEITGLLASACAEPANQPTAIDLNDNTTYNSIDGTFTASAGSPVAHGYLIVRNTVSSLSADPVDATSYSAGESLGGGTVVSAGSGTSFSESSLNASTQYYFFVFAYQNTACSGGPEYNIVSPLTGNETTTAGPDISLGALTAFGNICVGTTAGPNSFTISGTNLTTDDITIAALTGYTYCTTSGGTYTSTLTISGHGGGTYNTTIYVKFLPVAATTYNGNIAVTGAGITGTENCAASGTGIALPTIAGTTPGSVCNSGTVNLSATASAGTMDWYNVSTGGTSLSTGANFTTPSISSTTSYWVETDDGACTSTRTEVVATVNTTPAITSSLTASGTTGNAFSYFITGSLSPTSYNATGLPTGLSINTSTGAISGTPSAIGVTNVTISATNACGTGNETLVITITAFAYYAGDYRSTADCSFATDNPAGTTDYWEYYDGSSWTTTPTNYGPANAGTTPGRVLIEHNITCTDNASQTYNDIIMKSGGTLTLTEDDDPPAVEFINASQTIEIMDGGTLLIQGDIDLPADGALIVREGGTMTIDQASIVNNHTMWDGVENFEAGSTIKVLDWDFGTSATYAGLVNISNAIANNTEGYKFGYLTIDVDGGTEDWAWCGGSYNEIINLAYNNVVVDNAGSGYIGGITNKTSALGYRINGDLIVNSGNFNFSATYSADDFAHQAFINGDFEFNSTGSLYLHRNGNSTPDAMWDSEESFVHFKGNITVNPSATFSNDISTDNSRMYIEINGSGTEADPQLVDIGVTTGMTGINTNINNNTFVQLASNNWIINGITGLTTDLTLETGSSLHFGWADDNSTPLIITTPGGAVGTNTITTETGTTLYMTHAQGLDDGANLTNSNVQQFTQANRSFNQVANFWYVGKANQVTGNGITTASTNKLIGINMSTASIETTLTDDITTSGKLILMQGVLITTSSELFTLEDGATVHTDAAGSNGEPGSANSWVDGPVKKIGNDIFVFPLGETIWAPIGITAPSNATDAFTGEYFHSAYSDITNMDATIDHVSDIDYWDITSIVGSSLPTVTAYWKDNRYGITDIADVVVAHYDGGLWKDMGNTNSSGSVSNGSIDNSVAFSSFSPITLGFKNTPTPVELLSFDANRNNSIVELEWATASEQNNDYFTIEKSKDAKVFEFVSDYPGAGNSTEKINYRITDFTPYNNISYYRLKQTDFDGKFTYSKIIEVKGLYEEQASDITISKETTSIHINIDNISYSNECSVMIIDMLGRVLFKKNYKSFSNDIYIENESLIYKKGVYNITVIHGDNIKTQKIVW